MKEKGKIALIVLSLIGFATVAVLLVMKIGDIGNTQGDVNKKYKITYSGNGGTYTTIVNNKNQTYSGTTEKAEYQSCYIVKDNMFRRNGYVFAGWNTKKDGSGVDWTGDIDTCYLWTRTSDLTLYAQWKKGTKLISNPEFEKCEMDYYGEEIKYSENLTAAQLAKITAIRCDQSISSLSGIETMKSLSSLFLYSSVPSINLSKNKKIASVFIRFSGFKDGDAKISVNLTKNTNLEDLGIDLGGYTLKSLDLSKNTKLKDLTIYTSYYAENGFKSINLQKNTELNRLYFSGLPLTSLDLTKNTKLAKLTLNNMFGLKSLNLKNNKKLVELGITGAPLTSLDLTKNTKLERIGLQGLNKITSLNLKYNTKLTGVSLDKMEKLKTVTVQNSVPQNNIVLSECPNGIIKSVAKNIVSTNVEVEASGLINDNFLGKILKCTKDNVQFTISSNIGSTIKKVEYTKDGTTWKGFNSKNITYKDGKAILKITSSQDHLMFRITDKAGNVEITNAYRVCIEK